MKCERSVMVITLLRLDYLVYDLGNCVDNTPIEIGLRRHHGGMIIHRVPRLPQHMAAALLWNRLRMPVTNRFANALLRLADYASFLAALMID